MSRSTGHSSSRSAKIIGSSLASSSWYSSACSNGTTTSSDLPGGGGKWVSGWGRNAHRGEGTQPAEERGRAPVFCASMYFCLASALTSGITRTRASHTYRRRAAGVELRRDVETGRRGLIRSRLAARQLAGEAHRFLLVILVA